MLLYPEKIISAIHEDFAKKYKAFGSFVGSGFLWEDCLAAVCDATLMNHIIFCNDVHQIPPVHTFLKVKWQKDDLSEFEKRAVGAFWGFVFKFAFGYRNQHSVTARVNTVKTATYFYDVPEQIEIRLLNVNDPMSRENDIS